MTLARVFQTRLPPATIFSYRETIRHNLLHRSRHIQTQNFARCHDHDLTFLFTQYDQLFFDNQIQAELSRIGSSLHFRFSGRLRSSGGVTRRHRDAKTRVWNYSIDVSHNVLFENFRTLEETAVVVGVECLDRLDALMRIFEHELLHLSEFVIFDASRCSAARFQDAAYGLFGHTAHKHAMLTRRQKAISSTSFRPGHRVRFIHEGRMLEGRINRINQRATVLVEDARGVRYTDGRSYQKFYVAIKDLVAV